MKIAILSIYSGINNRGVESFVDNLARELTDKKIDVTVFHSGNPTSGTNYQQIKIRQVIHTSFLPVTHISKRLFIDSARIGEFMFFLKALPRLRDFDVIIPLVSGWPIPILRLFTFLTGKKMVIIGQSGPGWDDRFNLFWKPNLFVALTNSQVNWAKKASLWSNQNFVVIPNGVDLQNFSSTGEIADIKLQKPIILCAAASTPAKRIEATIEAVSKLKQGSLLLLGKGAIDRNIDELGNSKLGKHRFLHMSVPHLQMPKYFRTADLFTLCSESSEAFGIVYVEALATGLGCVATDDESRREIIGKAGMFVKNPDDTTEYTNTLEKALKKDWSKTARDASTKYSWDKIGDRYYKALSDL